MTIRALEKWVKMNGCNYPLTLSLEAFKELRNEIDTDKKMKDRFAVGFDLMWVDFKRGKFWDVLVIAVLR